MISEPVSKTGMEIADFLIDSYANERGVLRPADVDLSSERASADDPELVHIRSGS